VHRSGLERRVFVMPSGTVMRKGKMRYISSVGEDSCDEENVAAVEVRGGA
jgi:hypothetical protein